MTLLEACQSCKEGNFVSHRNFGSDQSMHGYKACLYYEDGANLSYHLTHISPQGWAKDGWYVKYEADKVNSELLSKMHEESNGLMLLNGSYEDCVTK